MGIYHASVWVYQSHMDERQATECVQCFQIHENWREKCKHNFTAEIFDCLPIFAGSNSMKKFYSSKILLCGLEDVPPLAKEWVFAFMRCIQVSVKNPYRKKQHVKRTDCEKVFWFTFRRSLTFLCGIVWIFSIKSQHFFSLAVAIKLIQQLKKWKLKTIKDHLNEMREKNTAAVFIWHKNSLFNDFYIDFVILNRK